MKNIFKFLMALPLAAIISCVGQHDDITPVTSFVKLTAEKTQVDIDKAESMVFTVSADSKDVTSESYIVNVTDGGYKILKNGDGTFAYTYEPRKPGAHTFIAIHGDGSSSQVSIRAIRSSAQSSDFYRRSAIYKFTGTWCVYCPAMGTIIEEVSTKRPDRLIEVAVHNNDLLSISMGDQLMRYVGGPNLPAVMVDYFNTKIVSVRTELALTTVIDESKESNPTVAGIKMAVKQVGNKLEIETETMVNRDGNYNLIVGILVDGYAFEQTGASDASYRQNCVLREYLTTDVMGDKLGEDLSGYKLVSGETVPKSYSYTLPGGIDISRYRVVALVLNKMADGKFYTNNIVQCNVGQSVDYQYEDKVE